MAVLCRTRFALLAGQRSVRWGVKGWAVPARSVPCVQRATCATIPVPGAHSLIAVTEDRLLSVRVAVVRVEVESPHRQGQRSLRSRAKTQVQAGVSTLLSTGWLFMLCARSARTSCRGAVKRLGRVACRGQLDAGRSLSARPLSAVEGCFVVVQGL